MVVLWQNGSIRTTVVVFGEGRCIRGRSLYSGNVVVFGQKWLCSGRSGCIRANWLFRAKVAVFGQNLLYSGKVVAFGQRRLYFVKMVVLR